MLFSYFNIYNITKHNETLFVWKIFPKRQLPLIKYNLPKLFMYYKYEFI
jgi:hypothetical protein